MSVATRLVALCGLLLHVACGGGAKSPSAPSPPAVRWSLSGTVTDRATSAPLGGARLEVTDGPNAGRATVSQSNGAYRLDDLQPSGFTLRVTAEDFLTDTRGVTLGANTTLDVGLSRLSGSTSGRAVSVLSGAAVGAATIALSNGSLAVTSSDGVFQLAGGAGTYDVVVTGSGIVERRTTLRVPGPDATVTLIPTTFDLATFDQMCRGGGLALRRWDTAPGLVVIDRVLGFTTVAESSYQALDEGLGAAREAIAADLAWGLPQVTGDRWTAFASLGVETPSPGSAVQFFTREGAVVVARFRGLRAATGYWGYGRWASRGGVVRAGAIMLDADFETSTTPYLRSLRVHELGHALGYDHVTLRPSFMSSTATIEPNAFDRDATRIAFERTPGNRSPDIDPSGFSANAARRLPLVWGPLLP